MLFTTADKHVLITSDKEGDMRLSAMFVCLSVRKITQKTRAWIWMKLYASTGVGTWTN